MEPSSSSQIDSMGTKDSRSRLEERRKLYPGLYQSDEAALQAIAKFAVIDADDCRKRPRLDSSWHRIENANGDAVALAADEETATKESEGVENGSTQPKNPESTAAASIYSNADIWGNIPPKEPKYLVECQVCLRQVSVSRFAAHLDKCMGLGTVRGAGGSHITSRGTANQNR